MCSEFENMDKEYSNLKKILMIRKREANVITVNSDSKKVSWIKKNDFDIGYIMLFTSGTSGHSKGVLLRKELFLRNVKQVIEYTSLTNEDSPFEIYDYISVKDLVDYLEKKLN